MRLFVAINLPNRLSGRIFDGTERLRALPGIRWVAPASVHLTLKFIGAVGEDQAAGIAKALRTVAGEHAPFDLLLTSVGAFPSLRRPRVIWLGVEEEEELLALQRRLEDELARTGVERDRRPYHPHLTLGRVKRGGRTDLSELPRLASNTDIDGSWKVKSVDLMRSHLKPDGAEYETVASEPLGGDRNGRVP